MPIFRLSIALRYVAAFVPGIVGTLLAFLINTSQEQSGRAQRVADHARLAAASVDLRLGELLELTRFCASAPALTERIDLASVAENCGRFASEIGAWVVVVETGETHRQILNTRADAPPVLPSYARAEEHATLLALEAKSRSSGTAGFADVFAGIVYPGGVVSAGQYLRLADGRSAMLYVSVAARTLSEQLDELAVVGGPIFGLVDPSGRVVARSVGIDRAMFVAAPDWLLPLMESGAAGAALAVTGPEVIGGTWDAGYHPLRMASGWMAAAFQPTPAGARLWAPASLPSAVNLFGIVLSGLFVWVIADRERAARRIAEADRRNREKSRLLASFAHDIRNPLISVISSLELVEAGRGTPDDLFRSAHGSAEMLLQLVDDILELSFLGSGELTLHPSAVDLRQLAAALLEQNRLLAAHKGLELRLDLDPTLPVTVEVDRLRLQQILTNLLTNAVKYTDTGSVTLRVRHAGRRAEDVTLDLAVIDTGIGVAQEDVPKILSEFGRLERDAERREQGTGLGLAIVQRILTAMGSSLRVESAPRAGSTFSFRLTLPVASDGNAESKAKPLSGVVILYAEDEPLTREVTASRLKEAGAKVLCAEDGVDALGQLRTEKPDLLLIDLQMPGLDGVDLIRRLKQVAPVRTPLFVLTSYISGPCATEARTAGADAVFTKPVQVAALAAALRARRGDRGRSTLPVRETSATSDATLLDMDKIKEVAEILGAARAYALTERFEAAMRADLSKLAAALEGADLKKAGELAHRCVGLCLVMGAVVLVQRLRDIEIAIGDENMAAMMELERHAAACFEATLAEMRSALQCRE